MIVGVGFCRQGFIDLKGLNAPKNVRNAQIPVYTGHRYPAKFAAPVFFKEFNVAGRD